MPTNVKQLYILAMETSCDETAAAVLAFTQARNFQYPISNIQLPSNIVSSQVKLHAKFGGVVPMLAAREQQKNIESVLRETLRTAKCKLQDIDYFAVTRGPGLIPSLHVGVNYARAIAFAMQKPLLGINHLEGHIYSNWLPPIREFPISNFQFPNKKRANIKKYINPQFPILNLIVSGGHTELILMRGHGKYEIIGETLDDAAGEAFDKVARMLGLAYPGGPALAKMAEKGNPAAFNFPRPMIASKNFNFSFSGLKTAVLYKVQELSGLSSPDQVRGRLRRLNALHNESSGIQNLDFRFRGNDRSAKLKADICASFEQAVVDTLAEKTIRAAKIYRVNGVFIAGGVSANKKLRKTFAERIGKELPGIAYRHPDLAYTGDNAAMIAMAAYQQIANNKKQITREGAPEVTADANLRIA